MPETAGVAWHALAAQNRRTRHTPSAALDYLDQAGSTAAVLADEFYSWFYIQRTLDVRCMQESPQDNGFADTT